MPAIVPSGERRRDLVGAGLIGLASLQFGTVVVVGKIATESELSVYWVLAVRFALSAALLAVTLAVLHESLLPPRGERLWLVALGGAGYGVEASFFFLGLEHGNASIVTLLFFTYPAMTAGASFALGRGAPGPLLGGALVCAVAGAGLVVASSGGLEIDAAGVAFALGAAASFTAYLLVAERVIRRTPALVSAAWVSGFAGLGLAAFSLVTGRAAVPRGLGQWGPIVWMALVTAGAFVCLFAGLRLLGAVRAAIIASSEPVAGAGLSIIFLGEALRPLMTVGGLLILAASVAAAGARRPGSAALPPEPPTP
jgi:drug/metabolite transporter (DMT)-like permease